MYGEHANWEGRPTYGMLTDQLSPLETHVEDLYVAVSTMNRLSVVHGEF